MVAGASSHYSACMRAHANAHSKGYPFARSVTPSPRMTCNISTCAKRTACSRTTWRWNYCCHSMKHDQLAHTERICEQWVHAGVRAASDEKGNIHSNNENNQNKWCVACDCMQTCLGMRMRCSTAEWHGLHGYSGVSVAHDLCMRVRLCACLCGIVGTYLCCHGLRCGSSSRRPGHGRPDSPPLSASLLAVACAQDMRSWKASFGHSGICPHGMRGWKREGLTACTHLGCALARKAAAPAVERVAAIFGNGLLNAFKTAFQCENIHMKT